MTMFELEV